MQLSSPIVHNNAITINCTLIKTCVLEGRRELTPYSLQSSLSPEINVRHMLDIRITIDVRSTRNVRFIINTTLSVIPSTTRSPMLFWSQELGQSIDQRLPDDVGLKNELSHTTTESYYWRSLGGGKEKG